MVFEAVLRSSMGADMKCTCEQAYYICIADDGGRDGAVQNMKYHLPQHHLIRVKKRISNHEVGQLVMIFGNARKNPRIIGSWGPKDEGLPAILDYEDLCL